MPLKISEWDPLAIDYKNKYVNPKNNMVTVSIVSKQTGGDLIIQTEDPSTCFGASIYQQQDSSGVVTESAPSGNYNVTILKNQYPSSPSMDMLWDKLSIFTDRVVNDVCENQTKWFGIQPLPKEFMIITFNRILKPAKIMQNGMRVDDPNKPPMLKLTLKRPPNKPGVSQSKGGENLLLSVFNTNKELIYPSSGRSIEDVIPRLSQIVFSMHIGQIYYLPATKAWGVSIYLKQCIVKPQETVDNGICHLDISDTVMKTISNQTLPDESMLSLESRHVDEDTLISEIASVVITQKKTVETYVDDSDEEESAPVVEKKPLVLEEKEATPVVVEKEEKKEQQPLTVAEALKAPVAAVPKKKVVKKTSA